MNYFLAVIAFLMTVFGILGTTWGPNGPTQIGWTILGLAFFVLLITLRQHYVYNQEREKIAEVAKLQACRGAYAITAPFAILLVDATVREYGKGSITEQTANDLTLPLHEFLSVPNEDHLPLQIMQILDRLRAIVSHDTYLRDTSLNDISPLKQPTSDHTPSDERTRTTWRNIFQSYALKGINDLDATLSSYRGALSSIEVTAIQDLRNTWLTQRLENLSQQSQSIRLVDFLRLHERRTDEHDGSVYEEFLGKVHDVARLCATPSQHTG